MSYGSWSGGIWILKLDAETGLRDYNVSYPVTGSGDNVTSDPYFGKRIAGGFYSSGEGSYIEYIDGYYFLFVSNGGLAEGGKQDDYNFGGAHGFPASITHVQANEHIVKFLKKRLKN